MNQTANDTVPINLSSFGATSIKYGKDLIYERGEPNLSSHPSIHINEVGDLFINEPGNYTKKCFYFLYDSFQNYTWTKITGQNGNYTLVDGKAGEEELCKVTMIMSYDWCVVLAILFTLVLVTFIVYCVLEKRDKKAELKSERRETSSV